MSSKLTKIKKSQIRKEHLMWNKVNNHTWTLDLESKTMKVAYDSTLNEITGKIIYPDRTTTKYSYTPKSNGLISKLIKKTMINLVQNHI